MLTVEEIKKSIENTAFEFYGIRIDDVKYNVGEIANNSHQLFQDPEFDENEELVYPYIEEGQYQGFYDAGELSGTCAIGFDAEDDDSIWKAISQISVYPGSYIHVLGGNRAEFGFDFGEIIISDAEVLLSAKI